MFGSTIALYENYLAVGDQWDEGNGEDSGAAYIFHYLEGGIGNWGQVKKVSGSDVVYGDLFGGSISLFGDYLVAGSFDDDKGESSGAAYIFHQDEGGADNWGQVKKIIPSYGESDDYFGRAAIFGHHIMVGSPGDDDQNTNAGAVYYYKREEVNSIGSKIEEKVPTDFKLNQNYPNPFNPETTIEYFLGKAAKVKIEVYNCLGQKVAVLVDSKMNPGNHKVKFDASGFPSGIYFYSIKASEFHSVKKMLLLR